MARDIPRLRENVPGRYYVDIRCIGCMLCSELAPDVFRPGGDETDEYNYVHRQPSARREEELCAESMRLCPVDAIGDDGE